MWTYVITGVGITLATWIVMYLDSRLMDRPKTKATYFKVIALTNAIVFATLGIFSWLSPTGDIKAVIQSGGGDIGTRIPAPNGTFVSEIGEEMFSGEAPF
jgi:hypothetical protein